ncbi:MAG: TonB-dependent receptor [Candidatus Andeanibacterium colombiense]|uniref:TonB-dependent receptor n=1 Tax=Candidatus Andeanibacterium colombiense TaxID=3121345 RepID=A0AAJ5X7C1_9SPHN|nr:MAG: TonB-dependent receptor [Sphingomonadaceae bacterium]
MNTTFTRTQGFKTLLLAGTVSAIALTAVPAYAQDDSEKKEGDAIIVTGSRIQRADYENNSPTVTVDEGLLQNTSTAAIETSLNKLPQFTPAQTPSLGADIQPTATNTPGAATVSLRGIGSNRNLVLIDGRRGTPANASGVIDISTIPSAAVQRIEIISGGASATYGADAVAGVTNFILKKDVNGLELDGQMGVSQHGDGFEYQISGIMGADFDDGRGNVSLAMSMNDRGVSYRRDRKWYRELWADPEVNGTQFFVDRPGILLDGQLGNYASALPGLFPGSTLSPYTNGVTVYLDQNGHPYVNNNYTDVPNPGFPMGYYGSPYATYNNFQGYTGPIDNYKYKVADNGLLSQNNTNLQLVLPLKRYNVLARGNYEINDWIGVFGQAMFSHVHTETRNEPGPITGGWGVTMDILRNDPTIQSSDPDYYASGVRQLINQNDVGTDLWNLLMSRDNPYAPFSITALMPDDRQTFTDVMTYNLIAGLEGFIPGTDWTWDISANHGVSSTYAKQTGIYSLERLRTVLNSGHFGEGFQATGNPSQGGFGASTATCTSGLNFYNPPAGGFSEDCLEAIRADLKNRSLTRQTIVEANLQGKLLDLPAGELRAALGASYRELNFEFDNDTLTTQGRSFNDQALGIYPSGNSAGSFNVKELYGELLVPILSDTPFIKNLGLELGGRISDYNTTGTSYTYKILGDWQVNDWLRFRGGYNRAERAPNIGELYLAKQQTFGVNTAGDLCSLANPLPYSANPTNANGNNVLAVCKALMPNQAASDAYYSGAGATDNSTFGFAWPSAEGNANLTPETANTWTAGVVLSSPFDSPALSRLKLTVDYYNIAVNHAIGQQSVAIALRSCFDASLNPLVATDPTAAAATAACKAITRDSQTGNLGNVNLTYANNGRFKVEGIDAQLDWSADVGPGTLGINSQLTYLLHFYSAELPTDPVVDYAGTQGPTANGVNGGNYRWRLFTTLNYSIKKLMLGLQWQHLPSIEDATEATFHTTTVGAPAYDIFYLNGNYALTDNINIRFGVDNLFNKAPPLTNYNPANIGGNDTQLRGGSVGGLFYDDIGRRFYLGANVKF